MDILMPQLGETVAEGKITTWFKSVGDSVKPGDNLFEIETDKVSMEVPATSAGVLSEIRVDAGAVAPVGAIVAVVSGAGETAKPATVSPPAPPPPAPAKSPAPPPMRSAPTPSYAPTPLVAATPPRVMDPFQAVRTPERNYGPARLAGGRTATPLARRLAAQAGIDLSQLSSSGANGRIAARDVENAQASGGGAQTFARGSAPSADRVKALFDPGTYEEIPLDGMRRTIATRLIEAKQSVPHFYLVTDAIVTRLLATREEANAGATNGVKLSVNDFVIKALALALQEVPEANAVWAEDRILRFRHSDIGIAVALDGGLITPVIRAAETKPLNDLSAEMKDLAARARDKKLKPQNYRGGASAISNLGMYGVREFSAIINPPHATILAVGATRRAPVETEDGGFRFESVMTLTMSCDHRVVDGALGAQLLAAVKRFVEHPIGLMVR
jgi:pyruvate dehydrogenase E2 component (dihydrolipoamide acetyltransferase)